MVNRKNTAVAFTLVVALTGCAEESLSTLLADGTAAGRPVYVGLTPWASATDAEAFKLVAVSPLALDPESVSFCFGDAAQCADPTQLGVKAVAKKDAKGRGYFESVKFFRTSANLAITVLAKDDKGSAVTQTIKIVTKGSLPDVTPGTQPVTPGTVPPTTPVTPAATACHKAPDEYTCQVEQEIARLTNEKRKSQGLAELTFDAKIGYVSRLWSVEQAGRNDIGHEWFTSGEWGRKYQAEFSEQSPAFAENVAQDIAAGTATADATALVEAWWRSPGHKANILGSYTLIGVGFQKSGGKTYGTQNFGQR